MSESSSSKKQKAKSIAIAVGISVLTFVVGFFVATFEGDRKLRESEEDFQEEISKKESALSQANSRIEELKKALAEAHFHRDLLQAYRQIHLGVLALEERNFGICKDHIQQAGRMLVELEKDDAAKKEPRKIVGEVAKGLVSWEPDVTQDVGDLRQTLLRAASRLDPLVETQESR